MSAQVKSRARVQDHGEVFTNEREVNAMLDMVKQETARIDSRFLEPACGDGNFLAEVLRRKLSSVRSRYRRSLFEYEKYAFVAIGSIYGVDILEDNTQERALGSDIIETIVNKSEGVKKAKREKETLTPKEKRELSEEEKELKSKRKQVQEKLIKFATRIPVFMYLTDYREQTLKDVITQLEPGLFRKVTGLDVSDFELLVSLGVFNDALMNDAVYKFRRYEDSSLTYAGVNRHEGERVGLFDTSLSEFDYMAMAQQESMVAPNGLARTGADPARASSGVTGDAAKASRDDKTAAATIEPATHSGGTTSESTAKRDWIVNALDELGAHYLDKRGSGGCLWVYGGSELVPEMKKLATRGATFRLSPGGGKATGGRSAWWLRDYPEEREDEPEAKPAVTQEELDSLEPGATVFHKAFGYGSIVDLGDGYVEVAFDNDDRKKKPSRKFMFPGSFFQGLLQIG